MEKSSEPAEKSAKSPESDEKSVEDPGDRKKVNFSRFKRKHDIVFVSL